MPRLVTKFSYLTPDRTKKPGTYAKYIATRTGVDKIDDSSKYAPATVKQQCLILNLLRDYPDSNELIEYEDYQKQPTIINASEFISRAIEVHYQEAAENKTYADYIATRPRVEKQGSHGLFSYEGEVVKLSKVSKELERVGWNR